MESFLVRFEVENRSLVLDRRLARGTRSHRPESDQQCYMQPLLSGCAPARRGEAAQPPVPATEPVLAGERSSMA
ncbi:hypothetical protein [Candidatus Palauibacter sp.]|uniref:hypothetical protein n=1 Tax=Candidatus Palauibacter sp. TaxID=3101350 RepID=UPI003B52700A